MEEIPFKNDSRPPKCSDHGSSTAQFQSDKRDKEETLHNLAEKFRKYALVSNESDVEPEGESVDGSGLDHGEGDWDLHVVQVRFVRRAEVHRVLERAGHADAHVERVLESRVPTRVQQAFKTFIQAKALPSSTTQAARSHMKSKNSVSVGAVDWQREECRIPFKQLANTLVIQAQASFVELTTIGCLKYSLTAACLRLARSTPWNDC